MNEAAKGVCPVYFTPEQIQDARSILDDYIIHCEEKIIDAMGDELGAIQEPTQFGFWRDQHKKANEIDALFKAHQARIDAAKEKGKTE
jgi:hypothetical protein